MKIMLFSIFGLLLVNTHPNGLMDTILVWLCVISSLIGLFSKKEDIQVTINQTFKVKE